MNAKGRWRYSRTKSIWCQGSLGRDEKGRLADPCTMKCNGSLRDWRHHHGSDQGSVGHLAYGDARTCERTNPTAFFWLLSLWNDEPGRKFAEVVEAFRTIPCVED